MARSSSPRLARAVRSPWGFVLAAVAAVVVIAAGGGWVAAPVAVVVWGGWVLVAGRREPRPARIDPFTVSEPWRHYVMGAQSAKLRFERTVAGTTAGPIRDRLETLSERLDHGIDDCWQIARRGHQIDQALKQLGTAEAQRQLDRLSGEVAGRAATDAEQRTIASLRAQLDSAARMRAVSADADSRLRVLDARLDELVAKAVEVSVGAGDTGWLSDEVDGVVTELEALRLAIEDTNHAAGRTPPALPPDAPPAAP